MQWIAPSEKDTANHTLEKRLWEAADQLRANSGLTAAQYSTPVLGLIFLRFAEARFAKRRAELEDPPSPAKAGEGRGEGKSRRGGSRIDEPAAYHAEGVVYLTPNARFDRLLNLPEGENVGKKVNDAMADIEKHNPQLAGVLPRTYQIFNSTLLKELLKKVSEIPENLDLAKIEVTSTANFARVGAIENAADRLMAPESVRRDFLSKAGLVGALYRALKPDPAAIELAQRCGCLAAIAERIRTTTDPPDIFHVIQGIEELLDQSIAAVPFTIGDRKGAYFDLSKIDFEALGKKFEKNKPSNTDLERLKAAVRAQLERMVRLNRTRADYLEKFQELIESYNAGSRNIEEIFRELLDLSSILTKEQTRHVRENLSEEELTIFDILTRPGPDLTTEEREEVKKVAGQLLQRLKDLLVIGWR